MPGSMPIQWAGPIPGANRVYAIPPRFLLALNGSHLTRWRGPWAWPLGGLGGGNGPAKVVILVQLGRGKVAATLGKQTWQTQAFACAGIPSAIFLQLQDVRFEWQTSFQNNLAFETFAANGWLAFAATAANSWLACAANGWLLQIASTQGAVVSCQSTV